MALLGGVSARAGGAPVGKAVLASLFGVRWPWQRLRGSAPYSEFRRSTVETADRVYVSLQADSGEAALRARAREHCFESGIERTWEAFGS